MCGTWVVYLLIVIQTAAFDVPPEQYGGKMVVARNGVWGCHTVAVIRFDPGPSSWSTAYESRLRIVDN